MMAGSAGVVPVYAVELLVDTASATGTAEVSVVAASGAVVEGEAVSDCPDVCEPASCEGTEEAGGVEETVLSAVLPSPPQPATNRKATLAAKKRRVLELNSCICFTNPRIRDKTKPNLLQP